MATTAAAKEEGETPLVYAVKLSSTVPQKVTGEDRATHELGSMDLAMKLHYLKAVYFFKSDAVGGLAKIKEFKDPTFPWLDVYYMTAGRIRRRSEEEGGCGGGGRPFVKCNDSGIRYVEAESGKTVEEWLAMDGLDSLNDRLIYSEPLGPLLFFSPLVFLQITRFKCGGVAVGLSWAHILGDAFSAVAYVNLYARFVSGAAGDSEKHLKPIPKPKPHTPNRLPALSVKRLEAPVGDHWLIPNPPKMESHSFCITANQLRHIAQTAPNKTFDKQQLQFFEVLSAIAWKALANVRGSSGPRSATVIRGDNRGGGNAGEREVPSNRLRIHIVETGQGSVEGTELWEVAGMIGEKAADESAAVEEMVEEESADVVVYGANLTFVDLEGADVYGMEIKGKKPVMAFFRVDGIGEEGAVVVLPWRESDEEEGGSGGRMVNVTLPKDQLAELRNEFQREWGFV